MPADPRTIAEEALRLATHEEVTPEPWHVSGEQVIQTRHITRDVWVIPRTMGDLALIAHAGTHYATLARAYLEMVRDLPVVIEAAEGRAASMAHPPDSHRGCKGCDDARVIRAAIERLRALGGG